jgi:hypothetical protein
VVGKIGAASATPHHRVLIHLSLRGSHGHLTTPPLHSPTRSSPIRPEFGYHVLASVYWSTAVDIT